MNLVVEAASQPADHPAARLSATSVKQTAMKMIQLGFSIQRQKI